MYSCDVTVIIPTYKRATYLGRAINSVLNQRGCLYEVIVIDDNNPNTEYRHSTEMLMKQYESYSNVKYIKHSENKNGAAARNTGIKSARGKYITFLDDDDLFVDDRLRKCTSFLDENQEYLGVYTEAIYVENVKVKTWFRRCEEKDQLQKVLRLESFFGTGSNIFVRKEIIDKLNGFDESFSRHQDMEFLLRVLENGAIGHIPEILVIKFREAQNNIPSIEPAFKIRKQFYEKFSYLINDDNMQQILSEGYFDLLLLAKKTKRKDIYSQIIEIMNLSGKNKFKLREKKLRFAIRNNVLVSKVYYSIKSKRLLRNKSISDCVKEYVV